MKSFDRIKSVPRVASFTDEGDDGLWVIFKTGWSDPVFDPGAPIHGIHERTIRDVLRRMRDVCPCHCPDCAGSTPDASATAVVAEVTNGTGDVARVNLTIPAGKDPRRFVGVAIIKAMRVIPADKPWSVTFTTDPNP